jgi:iron complex outermembrane receptor protein
MKPMKFTVCALTVVAVLASSGKRALASSDDSGQRAEARHHYQAGLAHFNLREYKPAIDEFQAAYRLLPDPVFLYNLGQAYRLDDNPDQALYFYRAYLRTSEDAPNRREVEDRIKALQKVIADKQKLATPPDHALPPNGQQATPPAKPQAPTRAVAANNPATARPARATPLYKRWWLWTAVGVVVAGAAVGVGVGVAAQKSATFDANVGTVGPAALLHVRY